MLRTAVAGLAVGVTGLGCDTEPRSSSAPAVSGSRAADRGTGEPAESLALQAPGGVAVWFTDARAAEDSAGRKCVERVMEIRRGGTRLTVPLLYTGEVPKLIDDSTMRARVWLHCEAEDAYRVDLRTGIPTRVKP